jgi:hypothetical protein
MYISHEVKVIVRSKTGVMLWDEADTKNPGCVISSQGIDRVTP